MKMHSSVRAMLIAGLLASSALVAGSANANTLVVTNGAAVVSQVKNAVDNQVANAQLNTNGQQVAHNVTLSTSGINGVNLADVTSDVTGAAANANVSGSLSGSLNASSYDIGNNATSSATSGGGIPYVMSSYATSYGNSNAWNTGDALSGALNVSFNMTLPSAELTSNSVSLGQLITNDTIQNASAGANTGQIYDNVNFTTTAANLANQATVHVMTTSQ